MNPLSLAFLTVPDLGPVDAVRVAAEAGFDHVGLRLLPVTSGEKTYPLLSDPLLLREVKAALRDTGVSIGDVEIICLSPDAKVATFAGFLDRVAALGCRNIVVVGHDPDPERMTENFARLCQLAAPSAITVNLEVMPWTEISNLAQATHILETAGQGNGGLLVDALHMHRSGSCPEDLAQIDPAWLHVFQICDAPLVFDPGSDALRYFARTARRFPGEGNLDLSGWLRYLPADVMVSVEVPNHFLLKTTRPAVRARRAFESTATLMGAGQRYLQEMST